MSANETPLSVRTLEETHEEVTSHLKRHGTYDDIRVRLMDDIMDSEKFSEITKQFEQECKEFCEKEDLTLERVKLRRRMAEHFKDDKQTATALMLEKYINNFLKENENDLRDEYYSHAGEFLEKFVIDTEYSDPTPPQLSPTTPRGSFQKSPIPTRILPSPQSRTEDMDLGSDSEDVPPPAYSPVGNRSPLNEDLEIKKEVTYQECDSVDVKHTDQKNHDIETNNRFELDNKHSQNHTGDHVADCDIDDDDDAVSLDIDDVSSVSTADLVNFDDLIEVSDDEAHLMGLPKKSKMRVEDLVENLKKTHTMVRPCDVPIPPMDPPPSTEPSDSSNLSRNPPRNRKSNPRYNNEDFRLL